MFTNCLERSERLRREIDKPKNKRPVCQSPRFIFYEKDLWDSWDWDWDWDTNFERSQGLGPGQMALGRLGLGHDSLGRPGTDTLWDSCPWDSNPLGLLGRPMPIPALDIPLWTLTIMGRYFNQLYEN